MSQQGAEFPASADGDVLRRLREQGFDFSKQHSVDFNIDFEAWPPPSKAIEQLKEAHQDVVILEPQDGSKGEVVVQIRGFVTYEFVIQMQAALSHAMRPFGGSCQSWGVLHNSGNKAR